MDELFNRLIYSFIDSEFTFPFKFQKLNFVYLLIWLVTFCCNTCNNLARARQQFKGTLKSYVYQLAK